eukprot:GGOE01010328.1.p3 GENE.GGOE01010328.1~~GGOE01010328.1.p3  ORF type:complete len:159 (-),score=5.73 GGOE01010328.1:524-1000(-)
MPPLSMPRNSPNHSHAPRCCCGVLATCNAHSGRTLSLRAASIPAWVTERKTQEIFSKMSKQNSSAYTCIFCTGTAIASRRPAPFLLQPAKAHQVQPLQGGLSPCTAAPSPPRVAGLSPPPAPLLLPRRSLCASPTHLSCFATRCLRAFLVAQGPSADC